MKRYDRYKDSGIEWIGEIPEHWEVKKFGSISYMKGRIGWQGLKQSEFTQNKDEPFLITGMNFHDGNIRWDEVYHIPEDRYDEAPEIQLKESDILITKDGTIGKLLFIENIPYPHKASLNSHLLVLRPLNGSYESRFFYYQLQSLPFKHHVELTKTGTTFFGITQEAMGQYKSILPPLPEQHAIAAYLDRKTAEIDALIADKKRLLELYEEEKTALINQAVTKGITPGVPMKDSGVEWLGEVPEGWEVVRFNQFIDLRHGYQFRNFDFTTSGIKIIKISQLLPNGKLEVDDVSYISEDRLKDFTDILINEGDILMALTGGTIGKIIRAPEINEPLLQNYRVGNFFPKNESITKDFLFWILSSRLILEQILFDQRETGQPNIGKEDFSRMVIVLPPNTSEQHRIVRHIESENARIDAKKAKTEKLIELLVEYRAALISEVVTGNVRIVGL